MEFPPPDGHALMGRRRDTPDFKRSSRIHRVRLRPTAEERELTEKLIKSGGAGPREAYGQKLLNEMCARLRIPPVRLHVQDKNQPHKKQGGRLAYKEYGAYYLDDQVIRIANLTAVRGQVVAGKTFFDTLVHEFMHHLDRKLLRIPSTPHSPGFYNRIDDLKRKLLGGGEDAPAGEESEGQWEPPPKGLLSALERATREAREAGRMPEPDAPRTGPPLGTRAPRWGPEAGLFSSPQRGAGEKGTARERTTREDKDAPSCKGKNRERGVSGRPPGPGQTRPIAAPNGEALNGGAREGSGLEAADRKVAGPATGQLTLDLED